MADRILSECRSNRTTLIVQTTGSFPDPRILNPMLIKMITRPIFASLLAIACCFGLQFASAQQTVQSVFNDGVRLYNQEKYEEALQNFERILRANATHVYARSYAAKCKTALAAGVGKKNNLEGQLSKVIVPQIDLRDAPVGDVLDFLADKTEELTGGKLVPNFIYKGTAEQRENTLISLNLRSVPMTEVVKYVGQLSRSRVRYEDHAVVIDPNGSPSTTVSEEDALLKKAQEAAGRTNPFLKTEKPKSNNPFE